MADRHLKPKGKTSTYLNELLLHCGDEVGLVSLEPTSPFLQYGLIRFG
jgi:hypothetical protein